MLLNDNNLALVFARLQTSAAVNDVEAIYNHVAAQAASLTACHQREHDWEERARTAAALELQARQQLEQAQAESQEDEERHITAIVGLRKQLAQAVAEAAAAIAVVRRLEWSTDSGIPTCPICEGEAIDSFGHFKGCPIPPALSGTAGQALLDRLTAAEAFHAAVRGRWECQFYPWTGSCLGASCDPTDHIVCEALTAYDKAKEASGG